MGAFNLIEKKQQGKNEGTVNVLICKKIKKDFRHNLATCAE